MADTTLFDVEPTVLEAAVEQQPKLSADARRTVRQYDAVNAGVHPLNLALRPPIALHREAARAAGPADRDAAGLRCGTCRFREVIGHHRRAYPKCMFGGPPYPRATHGAGTDVRRWWPACVDYQPKEAA